MLLCLLLCTTGAKAQMPANDNCGNAENIGVTDGGYGLGDFVSSQINLNNATIQGGETFAPAVALAGLDKKSVWFKFSISTIRAVRVTLSQPGIAISGGDAGFAVYKANNCLPSNGDISTKLTSIVSFGNTYHPCVPAGDYLIQVSAKAIANGPINITVNVSNQTGAAYDHPAQAFAFGVAGNYARRVDFDGSCHSADDASEVCTGLANSDEYKTTAWFTFTTPPYLDYLFVTLSGTNGFFPGGGLNVYKKFGYKLYRGNAVTTAVNALTLANGCDSLLTNGYHCATKKYLCGDLLPNTTYSIQLFIHKDFTDMLRLGILTGGTAATVAPLPVSGIAASHALGNLNTSPAGISSYMIGYFGCNSKHSTSNCSPGVPAAGISFGGRTYNLSSFGTFTLQTAADVNIKPEIPTCGALPVIRFFKQSVTANCADLDLANLIGTVSSSKTFHCLSPGDYVIQILGIDSALDTDTITYKTPLLNANICLFGSLGTRYVATITGYNRKAVNEFSISSNGMVDSVNMMQPLQEDLPYIAAPDTFGCGSTVRPADTSCHTGADKIMYREFSVADSGTVIFTTLRDSSIIPSISTLKYKLYSGSASTLTSAQNIFSFPGTFGGLVPNTECINGRLICDNKSSCVVPGAYTFTTAGDQTNIGTSDQPTFTFNRTRTLHNSPFNAQDMGNIIDTIGPNGGTIQSDIDTWSCNDNAEPVNGYEPCRMMDRPATKAIYRQFYLNQDALLRIKSVPLGPCDPPGMFTLFAGKATDGLQALTPVSNKWSCFNDVTNVDDCKVLTAGWYTVISWATGPSYDSTMRLLYFEGKYNSYIGYKNQFEITVELDCKGPQFNRPYKASVQPNGQPHLLEWLPSASGNTAYPETFKTDTLPIEHFNCSSDTPFSTHPITPCMPSMTKVAYYVFRTTQVSFLQIDTRGLWGKVYNKDVRADSLMFDTLTPINECNPLPGYIQFCNMQPGTYTLVLFAGDGARCKNVTPGIFIDSVAYSRFDFAQNAYDFDVVVPDSLFHFGKTGDINPLDPNRPPSSDFIYCTTGSSRSDPVNSACNVLFNGNIYSNAVNQPLYNAAYPPTIGTIARRNLWYTFVAAYPGTIQVRVQNKTPNRTFNPQFAVFRSNVDGSIPFTSVQANGLIDSTINQGLQFIVKNYNPQFTPPCTSVSDTVVFFRPACEGTPTRYYVIVDNVYANLQEPGGLLPNSQVDVSVMIDSLDRVITIADHYYQAQNIVTNGSGTYYGPKDSYACASRDNTDPLYSGPNTCNKTLWYKFTSTISGNMKYRIRVDSTLGTDSGSIKLYRQIIPGDSTFAGLQLQQPVYIDIPSGKWQEACVSPGTYYFVLPGCGRSIEFVYPEIELTENEGDMCGNAIPVVITGTGSYSNSVNITCHTIGTDYGEFGATLTCPQGATTSEYKTSWFKLDVTGGDTLDVTTSLAENTNALSSDIKYRLMTGDCSAMQEQSCVLDAQTQNTYQCLIPGQSYYVQVITPVFKNGLPVKGNISLVASSVSHTDTCSPVSNCLAVAGFSTTFDCAISESVQFSNNSTFGTSISYDWNFGYNNQTSSDVSPTFLYPALTHDSTYNVRLIATNTGCGKADTIIKAVTVPARPVVNLGNDTTICFSKTNYILDAFVQNNGSYTWQDGSTEDTFLVKVPGQYYVTVSIGSCIAKDTVNIFNYPAASTQNTDTILCSGEILILSNGDIINSAGIFKDTLFSAGGCDSLIRVFTVTIAAKQNLGNDTTINICTGSSIDLNIIYSTGSNINTWSSVAGILTDVSSINAAGNYQLISATSSGCSDTVIITVAVNTKPTVSITNPAIVCSNTTVDITNSGITNGSTPGLAFTYWQDAAASDPYNNSTIATSGTYYIKGTAANSCFDIKPVTVTSFPLPVVNAGNDFAICNNDSAVLNAIVINSFSPVTFLWQPINEGGIRNPVSSNTIIKPSGTQQFIVTIKDSCNVSASDSIVVIMQPPVPAFAGNDTIAPVGLPHQLIATGGVNYAWQPASLLNNAVIANPLATIVADSILFTVIVTDEEGCTGYDTIKVKTFNGITYYVPNAFSPDGNGLNDVFKPIPIGIVSTEYFRIFNRYGEVIFETSQNMKGWDGTFKGKPQQAGNYVWMLKGRGQNGKAIEMKGNVVLVR